MNIDFELTNLETLEIVSDSEVLESIREGMVEAERGEVIPWEDVKRELVDREG